MIMQLSALMETKLLLEAAGERFLQTIGLMQKRLKSGVHKAEKTLPGISMKNLAITTECLMWLPG